MTAEWIMSLAAQGGSALMGAAATDAWQSARSGIVKLFRRGGRRRGELAADWLDEDATTVEQAEADARDQVRQLLLPTWQTRLADLLQEYPEVADELRIWAAKVQGELPPQQRAWVQNITAIAGGSAYGVMAGNQYIYQQPGESAGKSPKASG